MRYRTYQTLSDRSRLADLRRLPCTSLFSGTRPPKRQTRAAREPSPSYNPSWLTDADKFPEAISRFKKITANSKIMDSSLQQSIMSAILSAVATAVTSIQAKHESKMLSLREMIEKSLFLRESPPATPPPDPDATPKSLPTGDSLPKASTER